MMRLFSLYCCSLLLFLFPVVSAADWTIVANQDKTNNCTWLVVNERSELYASNNRRWCQALCDEMNRQKLGPCWWLGRQAQEVIDIQNSLLDYADRVVLEDQAPILVKNEK